MNGPFPTVTQPEYQQAHAWGLSTCIDIFDCDPSIIRNRELIAVFARDLCDLLGVRRFGDPHIVRFGEVSLGHADSKAGFAIRGRVCIDYGGYSYAVAKTSVNSSHARTRRGDWGRRGSSAASPMS